MLQFFNFSFLKNKLNLNNILYYFDFCLFILVILIFFYQLFCSLFAMFDFCFNFNSIVTGAQISENIQCMMTSSTNPINTSCSNCGAASNININVDPLNSSTRVIVETTTTTVIHDDNSWANAIRSLFIYGAGGIR